MEISTETNSPAETGHIGAALARFLTPGDIISLTGDLGSGKTRFVQGLAGGLKINELITSPTFAIIKEYAGDRLPLYHFDVYRLDGPKDLEGIGFEEYFFGDGVTVIEWGDKIASLLPEAVLTIRFQRGPGDDFRQLRFIFKDIRWQGIVEAALR